MIGGWSSVHVSVLPRNGAAARSRQNSGQHALEERISEPFARRAARQATDACRHPQVEHAKHGQAERKHHGDHHDQELLALKLLSPAQLEVDGKSCERQEHHDNPAREGESEVQHARLVFACLLDERQNLDRDDRQNARHHVENHAGQERQKQPGA